MKLKFVWPVSLFSKNHALCLIYLCFPTSIWYDYAIKHKRCFTLPDKNIPYCVHTKIDYNLLFDLSPNVLFDIHLRAIPQEVFVHLNRNMCSEIARLKILPHPPGAHELNQPDNWFIIFSLTDVAEAYIYVTSLWPLVNTLPNYGLAADLSRSSTNIIEPVTLG